MDPDLRHQRRGVDQQASAEEHDAHLHRSLGMWSLAERGRHRQRDRVRLAVLGDVSRAAAGPAALVSWVIGGGLMLMIALVFAELGMVRPESGGLVRYPLYSNGRLAASIVGWAMWLSYVGNPPVEVGPAAKA